MSVIGRRLSPARSLLMPCLAVVSLLAFLALGGYLFLGDDEPGQAAGASFEVALPERPATILAGSVSDPVVGADEERLANPAFTRPNDVADKPAAPDLDLVEASPSGPQPRISDDGRSPLLTYRRPFDEADQRPKVAIMIAGLGLQTDATNATFHLPASVSLSFSPYAENLPSQFERARLSGHEVLLELPMEPADYPASDPGPHTLRASGTADANIERLTWVLSRAPGYVAVAGPAGVFGGSPEAAPIVREIAGRGLGMVEIDGEALGPRAGDADLAYLSVRQWIDETPSVEAIDQKLADLEARAREEGSAIGVAEAYPITLQRLVAWSERLEERGVALVPVSAVLIERNDLRGANDQISGSNIAQSQN